ncbi:MAG: hypothetical protein ACD_18C00064G0009 [uncultured bacterium]|nr:MAG: hypothetical protein ACD_18C00064G0009 [uncultured bacterium]MDD2656884.1 pilin [Patescibacteria group bacterium]OGH83605.1 MAG: hypothetical protein A2488_03535 [Candidatus Magasanikbacteria bacterium RIFOXYC12_FULL_32_21b]OGH90661.1 MAG: hypothetical protein A2507_01870 [Candidatus Magasanikbacteria bacterium RIFOXYD12_FULL_33_17]HAO52307.1 hypothetical protein [Candidatus Magasanikbacteria bacterium]
MKNKKIFNIFFSILFVFSFLIPGVQTFAQVTSNCDNPDDLLGLNCVGENSKLSAQDPRIIITNIINQALGLLGIVATVLIIYAGFLWMTAGGDEGKAESARKIISAAVIGLVIILMAYSITRYVAINLYDATLK